MVVWVVSRVWVAPVVMAEPVRLIMIVPKVTGATAAWVELAVRVVAVVVAVEDLR
jgi:hypothetical protein